MRILKQLCLATLCVLLLCASALANGRVETVRFQSKLVGASLPYEIAAQKVRVPAATKRAAGA